MRKATAVPVALAIFLVACSSQPAAKSTPQASPRADYGAPPAGVPLFYLGDPVHPGWFDGFDWTGKPRGTIKLAEVPDEAAALYQSPDGSSFLLTPNGGKGGFEAGTQLLDRVGAPLPRQEITRPFQDLMWADDSQAVCTLDGLVGQWQVGLLGPGSALVSHPVAVDSFVARSGVIAIRLGACSPTNDLAVLTYAFSEYPTLAWIVRLSDGKILRREAFDRNALAGIVASPDGRLLAESSNTSVGYLPPGASPHTTVTDAITGANRATLPPSYEVLAFSADDTRALVTTSPWASGVPTHLALIKLDTGQAVWRYDGDREYGGRWIEPRGSSIAVMLQNPADQKIHASVEVLIVHGDGTSTRLPASYVRA